ncbi:unnamed protein product [Heterobilharzia americana]|nr:unnamed protein product [Heterobilharzia americana]
MCSPYGKVQTIKIVGSKKSTPPSIYAYLIMETSEAAIRLVHGLQGVKFSENELKVRQYEANSNLSIVSSEVYFSRVFGGVHLEFPTKRSF